MRIAYFYWVVMGMRGKRDPEKLKKLPVAARAILRRNSRISGF